MVISGVLHVLRNDQCMFRAGDLSYCCLVLSWLYPTVQGGANSVQTGAVSAPEQSWMQGYSHLLDSAVARQPADARFGFGGLSQLHLQAQASYLSRGEPNFIAQELCCAT